MLLTNHMKQFSLKNAAGTFNLMRLLRHAGVCFQGENTAVLAAGLWLPRCARLPVLWKNLALTCFALDFIITYCVETQNGQEDAFRLWKQQE